MQQKRQEFETMSQTDAAPKRLLQNLEHELQKQLLELKASVINIASAPPESSLIQAIPDRTVWYVISPQKDIRAIAPKAHEQNKKNLSLLKEQVKTQPMDSYVPGDADMQRVFSRLTGVSLAKYPLHEGFRHLILSKDEAWLKTFGRSIDTLDSEHFPPI